MTISAPDTLTSDNSGKYILSIRLQSDGLSFSGYIPCKPGTFFYRNVSFDKGTSYVSSLKDFFFSHDFLTWSYKQLQIIICSDQYTLVPEALFNENRKEDFLTFHFSLPETRCLSYVLKEEQAVMVFGIENEVYEFCSRSFINPLFIHHTVPQLLFGKRESIQSVLRRMYVVQHRKQIDIVCYDKGHPVFVNSFRVDQMEDMLYFILYVWQQVGLNQEKDQLFLFVEADVRQRIMDTLQVYLQWVLPVDVPSEAYLLGSEITHAPMDIIALSVCGL
ncbi:DUF3822 family protein [Parabacteroides sp. 52]|uniref:DUF3822 family protein n=1 Tax=unclassified Parabacteroides TaxID=2649774 RepID=UPI0013D54FA8|nr:MULTISPECIES: DUF3822 family protein [unclassified Parabacteroides]MDH6535086.1 hypothetical protein [Parabacteroides sp. PM5-20]NDV55514.1 DUF3822 family protein [Parabacteroides sp. 52]